MISHHCLCPWIATTSGEWRGGLGPFMADCHTSLRFQTVWNN